MKKQCSVCVLLILMGVISTSITHAQGGDDISFERLTIKDGLSQSSVYAILQDKRGLMWFGTWDGLNKYDGYKFSIYTYNPQDPYSLSDNEVRAIYEDSLGILWIGTMDGLNRFDRETERFIRFRKVRRQGDDRINHVPTCDAHGDHPAASARVGTVA